MTSAPTILRALVRCSRAGAGRAGARCALLGLAVLLLLVCLGVAPAFARSSGCAIVGCGQQLSVSLAASAEAAAEEGEEGEGEEAGEEEGEEDEEGAEGSSEREEDEEAASAEAEAEEEAEERRRGKRHGAHKRAWGGALVLSKLRLTHKSLASLKHSPAASQVEFSFSLVKSMKVRVTLVKQALVKQGKPHARKRWTAVPADSLTISATKGSNRHRLLGHNRLAAGRYRLSVWPVRGRVRSIYVTVRG